MKTIINLLFAITIFSSFLKIIAQPYYFYDEQITYDSTTYDFRTNIYRVNLSTGENQLFVENIFYPNSYVYDNYQRWFILNQPKGIYFYNPWSTTVVDSLFTIVLQDYGTFAYSIDALGYLYVGWVEPEIGYGGITKTTLLNINTLQTIKTDLPTYNNSSFTSSDNQFIYQYGGSDTLGVWNMFKYSVQTDLLVEDINLSELFPNIEYPVFEDGSNGKGLFGYNRIMSDSNTCEYVIYDFDNEMFTQEIACPYRCYGRFISNGNYFLLENVLWDESKPNAEYSSGRINIYETATSSLAKMLTLPSDGKLLLFGNYPNNIYYAIDIEKPTRQIYTLKMDSIFNVLDLTSLNPSSAIVNSSSFTLTINGHGFDTLSTIYFNDSAKTTTYISDSVLTAEISATDISFTGSFPVWVTDQWGTSDTLMFMVVPPTPYLSKISPSLALPYDVFANKSSFNVTVIGNNFTTSSVAYFNGVAKTTTYVSDSLVTFQLSSGDVGTTGKTVSVWIQNSNQFSDTLLFSVVTTLPNQITPILECVTENGANSYTAYFGYNNYNSEDVLVPLGTKNNISSQFSGITGSPVNIFISGRQTNVFSIDFNGQEILWQLNGSSVSVSSKSPPCP
ncbi:MAG: IPT/TIG domain-containing protein [Ignavibacteriaceae bacterium]|jgi:hypothetical protein|nr:IPT/TIG domain-containing protein [Ignavibacteriaceae bacterium]